MYYTTPAFCFAFINLKLRVNIKYKLRGIVQIINIFAIYKSHRLWAAYFYKIEYRILKQKNILS